MSVYAAGFERAIQNGGLRNIGNWRRGLALDGSAFGAHDTPVTSGSNSNPYENSQNAWSRTNERLFGDGSDWGVWTIDGDQTLGALDVEVPDGGGGWDPLGRIDGGDFPNSVVDATEVTLTINASDGTLNFVRPGIAETVVFGISNTTFHYVLLDGGGTVLASKQAGTGGPGWSYSSADNDWSNDAELTFTNNSGGSWTIEEVQVRTNSQTGATMFKNTSISTSVADGNSITFTELLLEVNGLA